MLFCKLLSTKLGSTIEGYSTSSNNFGNTFSSEVLSDFSKNIVNLMVASYSPEDKLNDWIDFSLNILNCNADSVVRFLEKAAKESDVKYTKLKNFLKNLDNHSLINAISNSTIYSVEPYILEMLIEEIRINHYPDAPSRLQSELGFCGVEHAKKYLADLDSFLCEPESFNLFELETKDCTECYIVDQNNLNNIDAYDDVEQVINKIKAYWSKEETQNPMMEVILQGSIDFKNSLPI
jgi:hypothetical protein